jgi:hypothetical protein
MPSKKSTDLVGIDLVKAALLDRSIKLSVVEEDPEVVQRRIIEEILDAGNVDEIWGGGDAVHATDIVDRPFRLIEATFHNSDYDEGSPIFTAMRVAFPDTGEAAIVTSGALGIVARVVKLIEFRALPVEVRIRQSKTNSGYSVLDLEPVPSF